MNAVFKNWTIIFSAILKKYGKTSGGKPNKSTGKWQLIENLSMLVNELEEKNQHKDVEYITTVVSSLFLYDTFKHGFEWNGYGRLIKMMWVWLESQGLTSPIDKMASEKVNDTLKFVFGETNSSNITQCIMDYCDGGKIRMPIKSDDYKTDSINQRLSFRSINTVGFINTIKLVFHLNRNDMFGFMYKLMSRCTDITSWFPDYAINLYYQTQKTSTRGVREWISFSPELRDYVSERGYFVSSFPGSTEGVDNSIFIECLVDFIKKESEINNTKNRPKFMARIFEALRNNRPISSDRKLTPPSVGTQSSSSSGNASSVGTLSNTTINRGNGNELTQHLKEGDSIALKRVDKLHHTVYMYHKDGKTIEFKDETMYVMPDGIDSNFLHYNIKNNNGRKIIELYAYSVKDEKGEMSWKIVDNEPSRPGSVTTKRGRSDMTISDEQVAGCLLSLADNKRTKVSPLQNDVEMPSLAKPGPEN
jgi:hypothetical protein